MKDSEVLAFAWLALMLNSPPPRILRVTVEWNLSNFLDNFLSSSTNFFSTIGALYRRIQSRVPQPSGAFKLERYSAAEEFPGKPDDEIVDGR